MFTETFEGQTHSMEDFEWRNNLYNNIKYAIYGPNYKGGIAQVIIDSIDAAYLQGLEESKKGESWRKGYQQGIKEENKEWREGRRCEICGEDITPSWLSNTCINCLKNG